MSGIGNLIGDTGAAGKIAFNIFLILIVVFVAHNFLSEFGLKLYKMYYGIEGLASGGKCPEANPYAYGPNKEYCCDGCDVQKNTGTCKARGPTTWDQLNPALRGTDGYKCSSWGGGYVSCPNPPCTDYAPKTTYYCSSGSGESLGTFAATSPEDCVTQCKVPYGTRTGLRCNTGQYNTAGTPTVAPAAAAAGVAAPNNLVNGDTFQYKVMTGGKDFCGDGVHATTKMVWNGKVCDDSGNIEWSSMNSDGCGVPATEAVWKRKPASGASWNKTYVGSCGVSPTYMPDLPKNISGLDSNKIVPVAPGAGTGSATDMCAQVNWAASDISTTCNAATKNAAGQTLAQACPTQCSPYLSSAGAAAASGGKCPKANPYAYGPNKEYCCDGCDVQKATGTCKVRGPTTWDQLNPTLRGTDGHKCSSWGGGYVSCPNPPCQDYGAQIPPAVATGPVASQGDTAIQVAEAGKVRADAAAKEFAAATSQQHADSTKAAETTPSSPGAAVGGATTGVPSGSVASGAASSLATQAISGAGPLASNATVANMGVYPSQTNLDNIQGGNASLGSMAGTLTSMEPSPLAPKTSESALKTSQEISSQIQSATDATTIDMTFHMKIPDHLAGICYRCYSSIY